MIKKKWAYTILLTLSAFCTAQNAFAQSINGDYIHDKIHGDQEVTGNIKAGEIQRASGWLGIVHYGLPDVICANSTILYATHANWIQIGTRIMAATDVVDPTPSIDWWTAKLIDSVTQWVINLEGSNKDTFKTNWKYTQWLDGDGTVKDVTLEFKTYRDTLEVSCITDPLEISHEIQWIEDFHYAPILDDQGDIVAVRPLTNANTGRQYQWTKLTTFRFRGIRVE